MRAIFFFFFFFFWGGAVKHNAVNDIDDQNLHSVVHILSAWEIFHRRYQLFYPDSVINWQ